jgi:tetratricopeptide (TPR) repeat protein
MAEVFTAKSLKIEDKLVVIKRILPALARNPEFVDMFVREAKLAVRLSHPNIVRVFDLGVVQGDSSTYFMAMEYVHGVDLAVLLGRLRLARVPMPVGMGIYLASEVAKALHYAHGRQGDDRCPLGIVHRDVSPQNVLVSFDGEVKLTDFGIAKAGDTLDRGVREETPVRRLHGKFCYVSPEQARGDTVDARGDLFALGIVLYECLAGVNPFRAPTPFETLRRVQACEYPPLELFAPEVPRNLSMLVSRALSKDPGDRFADAESMGEALSSILDVIGGRFGAGDLAELLSRYGTDADAAPHSTQTTAQLGENPSPVVLLESQQVRRQALQRLSELGERRDLTALVVAFPRGLPRLQTRAVSLLSRYDGLVVQEAPEQVAALFGLTQADGRETERAAFCALLLLRVLGGTVSAGIHLGRGLRASDGGVVHDEPLAALVAGARGLARVRPGNVALSEPAMREVRSLFTFEPLADSGTDFAIPGVVLTDTMAVSEVYGRFVGRKPELRVIGDVLARANRQRQQVVTVRGAIGVGKTRWIHELQRRLAKAHYNVGVSIATCAPRGHTSPLSGIASMMQVLCGGADSDAREDRLNAFVAKVTSLATERLQVMVWDSAEVLDEVTQTLLEGAVRALGHVRVVWLFVGRPELRHRLESFPEHVALVLGELSPPDAVRLVCSRLGVDEVSEGLLRFLRERGGGHPRCLEELLRGLVDGGVVSFGSGHAVDSKLAEAPVPKAVRGLVLSRLEKLSAKERLALQAAAVVGPTVDMAVLAHMLGEPTEAVESTKGLSPWLVKEGASELRFMSPLVPEVLLDGLVPEALRALNAAAGNAFEAVFGERATVHASRMAGFFRHAGDRERAATYFAVSGERHLEAWDLEAVASDFGRALSMTDVGERSPRELLSWLRRYARAVRVVRTAAEATVVCGPVLKRLDDAGDDAERVLGRVEAGYLFVGLNRFEKASRWLEEAEAIAGAREPLVRPVLLALAELGTRRGEFARSKPILERLDTQLPDDQANDKHSLLVNLAQCHGALGDHEGARRGLERAEELLTSDPVAACERQKLRGILAFFAGNHADAVQAFERAVSMARVQGLTYEVAANLHNVGDVAGGLGDYPRAYEALRESQALSERAGFERLASLNRVFLAYLDGVAGSSDGKGEFEQGITLAQLQGFTWDEITAAVLFARLCRHRGDRDGARTWFERSRIRAAEAGHRGVVEECERALGELSPQ